MTELRAAREVDMVPEELRFVPQVKSDIIIQRRNVTLAPIEAADKYTRDGTNTITFNIQGHRELSQLLDSKSMYFTWHCKFKNTYPVEDVAMLIEEVIISSNGRTIERIRHAQYIQHFIRGYGMSRESKARLGKRCGFQRYEDRTIQQYRNDNRATQNVPAGNAAVTGNVLRATQSVFGYGKRKGNNTGTAPYTGVGGAAAAIANRINGLGGYTDVVDGPDAGNACSWNGFTRMSDNLGYQKKQVARQAAGANGAAQWGTDSIDTANAAFGEHSLMKFRLPCSGLLSADKMLPIGWMPLTIQLRLSDKARATDSLAAQANRHFDYEITRPRLHMNVCSVGQAYASAMAQRLRGPGLTLNCKMFDTFFQIISTDKQIVIPSNKQRLSKVWVMFHEGGADTAENKNAFRSSVTGGPLYSGVGATATNCLQSYQFQVGTEVSEAVTLEKPSGTLNPANAGVNTGLPFLEAYLRSIGAVNGHEQDTEFWGRRQYPLDCNDWEGGDLLQTFLSKYFVAVYDGEKVLGSSIETGVDTESGKDIVVDLRFGGGVPGGSQVAATLHQVRVQVLIQYHAQVVIKENDVMLSY